VIDKATGQIDKISETLATDPQAKYELLDAVNDDGKIDFSKIEPENLDKFRDPTTQKLDLNKLENIAKDLVELEKSKPAGEKAVKKPVFDKANPQSSFNKIRETLATDSYAREQLRRAVTSAGTIDFNRISPNLMYRFKDPAGNVDFSELKKEAQTYLGVNGSIPPYKTLTFTPGGED
jgi:hypothetical protein